MTSRDEMVIRPRILDPSSTEAAGHADREQQAQELQRKRGFLRRLWRRTALARKAYGAKTAFSAARKFGAARGLAAAGGGIASGVALLAEGFIASRRAGLRAKGYSGRIVDAWDRHTTFGFDDEKALAKANARQDVEGRPELLRIMGDENRVNSQIAEILRASRNLEYRRARGADSIDRNPYFDAPESRLDYIIKRFKDRAGEVGLPEQVRRVSRKMREHHEGRNIEGSR